MAKLCAFLSAVLWSSLGWSAASQPTPATARASAAAPAKAPIGKPRLSDAQLETAIRSKFAKSKINEDHFTVSVQGGIAIVDGRTNVIQHKGVATRMCKTAGAIAVNNRVQISEAAKRKAAGSLENARRRAEVKRR